MNIYFFTLRDKAFFPFPSASLFNSLRKRLNLRLELEKNFSDPLPASGPMCTYESPLLGLQTQVGHVHCNLEQMEPVQVKSNFLYDINEFKPV